MNKEKRIKTFALLSILSIFIICLSLVAIKTVYQDKNIGQHKNKLELEKNAQAYEELIYESRNITLPGWRELSIYADTLSQKSCVDFYNPVSNLFFRCPKCLKCVEGDTCDKCNEKYNTEELIEDVYYLTFTLILDDTKEVLYKSNLVYPGLHIQTIDLTRGLEEGDYKATVLMDVYGKDMYTQFNSGEVKLVLHAKKCI